MKTSIRLLFLAVFAVLFVGTVSAHYNPQLGRWLSRDPMGEAGGFNLYAYCGNDPVNGHDPLGLQCWDPSYSPEMARRNAEGMRELWDNNGASQTMAELTEESQVINRRVARGEMSILEGAGRRVGLKGVQVVFGTIFSPFLYHDAGKAFGTYNPKTIVIDEGILNGVVHNGSENVCKAFQERDFASIMDAFDSGIDAALIWKGGKTVFGRNRLPAGAPQLSLTDAAKTPAITLRQRGLHHQGVVDDIASQLSEQGYVVKGNGGRFYDSTGKVYSQADLVAVRPAGTPVIFEVKTGGAITSGRQNLIYPQIMSGDAIPSRPVANMLGIQPGVPLSQQGFPNGIQVFQVSAPGL